MHQALCTESVRAIAHVSEQQLCNKFNGLNEPLPRSRRCGSPSDPNSWASEVHLAGVHADTRIIEVKYLNAMSCGVANFTDGMQVLVNPAPVNSKVRRQINALGQFVWDP